MIDYLLHLADQYWQEVLCCRAGDYKVNQCEGHAGCVPCHVRFPSCRGLQDGLNAWSGRQGSPSYVTCHQQRVVASAMCKQEGAVAIFDAERRECVKKEEVVEEPEVPQLPRPVQQTRPQTVEHQGYIPQHQSSYQQTSYLGNQNQQQQGGYQQGYRPQYPARNQNQYQANQDQYQPNQNQYQPGRNQNQYEPEPVPAEQQPVPAKPQPAPAARPVRVGLDVIERRRRWHFSIGAILEQPLTDSLKLQFWCQQFGEKKLLFKKINKQMS